jgi:hypothetical protein
MTRINGTLEIGGTDLEKLLGKREARLTGLP